MKKTKAKRALAAIRAEREVLEFLAIRLTGNWAARAVAEATVMMRGVVVKPRHVRAFETLAAEFRQRAASVEAPAAPLSRGREGKGR